MDAVERVRSVEELRESEQRLRIFIEKAPVALAMFDRELRFIAVSRQYIKTLNAPDNLIGRCAYDVFPETPDRWKQLHKRALAGESVSFEEDLFLRSALRAQWVKWKIDPWYESSGTVGGILLAAEDITARVEAERKVREDEERLALVMESAQIGTWDWDLPNNKIVASALWYQIHGIPVVAEMNYEGRLQTVHPDDRERVDCTLKNAIETKQPYSIEFRTLWPDGSIHWVSSRGKVFCDSLGRPVHVIGAAIDITKLKKTEEDLELARASARAQADELEAILDAVPALTFIAHDRKCKRVFSRQFAHEALGVPWGKNASESGTQPLPFALYEGERQLEPVELPIQQAAATGKAVRNQELRIEFPDGSSTHVLGHAIPLLDESGRPRGAVGAFIDISERKRAEQLLQERTAELENLLKELEDSELRFRGTFENAAVGIAHVGTDGRWLRLNETMCEILGYKREELLDRNFLDITYPEDREKDREMAQRVIAGEISTYTLEKRYFRKDGSITWAHVTVSALRDAQGRPLHFIRTVQNISERKAAEDALAEQRARSEFVAEASDVGFWFCDLPFDKLIWDKRVKRHFWLPENAEVTIGLFYERLHSEDRGPTREAIAYSIDHHTQYDVEYRTMGPSEQYKWIRAIGRTFYDDTGLPKRFDGITIDITVRKHAEEALRASEARYRELATSLERQVEERTLELQKSNQEALQVSRGLRELSTRVLQIRDEERRRLARDLHDSAGQLLTALGMELSALEVDGEQETVQRLESIKGLVQHLQQEIRTTSYLLHPPLLDEVGLVSALNWYVQGLNQRSPIETRLEIAEVFGRLPRDLELVVFRLVQESLTNIHRHSGSKTSSIRVQRQHGDVTVEIQDQGKGMSLQKLREIQVGGSGVGIQGMRERLRQYGGALQIESNESGTTVMATIPIVSLSQEEHTSGVLPWAI